MITTQAKYYGMTGFNNRKTAIVNFKRVLSSSYVSIARSHNLLSAVENIFFSLEEMRRKNLIGF